MKIPIGSLCGITKMTVLELSKNKIGNVPVPKKWSNEKQKYDDLNPRDEFVAEFSDKKEDWRTKQITQSLFFRKTDIPDDAIMYHKNYMEYLHKCWANHLNIVISPDVIWYSLLTELATIVKNKPEQYRSLFFESEEKQDIIIITEELVEMPLDLLVKSLKEKVPINTEPFMPTFTTSTNRSKHAFYSAFCDVCSPYYEYSMMLCGFPSIKIEGTVDDWKLMHQSWKELAKVIDTHQQWFNETTETLKTCANNLENVDWWNKMFHIKHCGSGGQIEVTGWYADLFLEQPSTRYVENFASCRSVVEYEQLDTKKEYKMEDGLFYSQQQDEFIKPDFGYIIHEKEKPEKQSMPLDENGEIVLNIESATIVAKKPYLGETRIYGNN